MITHRVFFEVTVIYLCHNIGSDASQGFNYWMDNSSVEFKCNTERDEVILGSITAQGRDNLKHLLGDMMGLFHS